jgi:uncharacterized protein
METSMAPYNSKKDRPLNGVITAFVKTPGLSPIKTRLAKDIGPAKAAEFYELSCLSVASLFEQLQADKEFNVEACWALAEKNSQDHPLWQGFKTVRQGEGGLGHRLNLVYNQLKSKYDYVIFIGADSPQLTLSLLKDAIRTMLKTNSFVLGPSYDGGFYLFAGMDALDKEVWLRPIYSCEQTYADLSRQLKQKGRKLESLSMQADVDHFQDLELVQNEIDFLPEPSAAQVAISKFISGLRAI